MAHAPVLHAPHMARQPARPVDAAHAPPVPSAALKTQSAGRWRAWVELALTLAVGWWLFEIARPLADVADGRNAVYALLPGTAPSSAVAQARWLQSHVGEVLAGWSAIGVLVLTLSRQALPASGFVCGATALWLAAWGALQQTMLGTSVWQVANINAWWLLAGMCVLAWPLLTRLSRRLLAGLGLQQSAAQRQCLRSAWLYPGFVLLSGLGTLWLLDYAARGPAPKHFLGLRHLQAWLGAVLIYTLAAGLRLRLMGMLAWVLSRADGMWRGQASALRRTNHALRWGVPLLALLWVGALVLAGRKGWLLPAVTDELLRAPLYLSGGWVLYRWLGASARDNLRMNARVTLRLALAAATVVLALFTLHDNGPILVLGYTACVVLSVLALHTWMQRYPRSSAVLTAILSVGLVLGLHAALVHGLAPWLNSLSQRLSTMQILQTLPEAQRLYAQLQIDIPVLPLDFLPRLHWFMQSVPPPGYGLGHTPWCGHAGNLGSACEAWVPSLADFKDNGVGLPWQTPSDYVFAGLLGVWGAWGACAVWVGLVVWLWRLLPQPDEVRRMAWQGPINPDALALWVVTMFAVSSLVQAAVTVLGTLAVTPMTGITLPLLSYGTSSLWVCASFAGLGSQRLMQPPRGLV